MEVISNIQIGPDMYKMVLYSPRAAKKGKAGQFIHIKAAREGTDPLLRRPFSLYNINKNKNYISIVYRVCGKGTKLLKKYTTGDKIDFIGPLGNGFSTNYKNEKLLILGGGMGIAPLYYLTKCLNKQNNVTVILGANSKNELDYFQKSFANLQVKLYTSLMNFQGGYQTVIDCWLYLKENIALSTDRLFCCGPEIMLKTIQKICSRENIPGEVSLEERMGCGIGVCLSCVCKTDSGNKRLCKEGPVLPLREVKFDE